MEKKKVILLRQLNNQIMVTTLLKPKKIIKIQMVSANQLTKEI